MDAFETIRGAAAALRSALGEASGDSARSMDVVEAAARHLELEVIWVHPDEPQLKGARATFDHQAGLILCATGGDSCDCTMRVAHEIGHVQVHASSTACAPSDIDPSLSMEAAPIGLQRVEDYGGRERRELQANVFARELLLPRATARRLHVDGDLSASTIAQRLDLTVDLVRQQLLDALLLPVFDAETPRPSSTRREDPSQDRVAAHRGSPFLLQAGPGTGKTRTLVNRVLGLLGDGVDPSTIAILTFSNRAAGEVAERVAAQARDASALVWIGTFHAFGLDLVRRYHDRLELPQNPVLFDRSDGIRMLEEMLPTLGLVHYRDLWNPARELREMLGAISRAKDELARPERYRELAQRMVDAASDDDAHEDGEKALEVARVYELYQETLAKHGAVDFGDLVMRPALLLQAEPAIAAAVAQRHRHVLVDEYQDMNRASAMLLRTVAGAGQSLWVVGDSRQSIYRFRGASSANMSRFSSDYPNAKTDQLGINYRSSDELVKALVAVAPNMGASQGMLELAFDAERGPQKVQPQIRRYETPTDELAGIVASVRELEAQGIQFRDQAVLCRTNRRLNEVSTTLEAAGIPVLYLGSIFERPEVRDLLALLTLVTDRLGDGLVRVGAMPRYGLSIEDVRATLHWLREAPAPVAPRLAAAAANASLSEPGRVAVSRLASDLDGFGTSDKPWQVLTSYLLDQTRMLVDLGSSTAPADRMKAIAIWQLLNFLRQGVPASHGSPIWRALTRVRQMVLLAEDRDLRQVPDAALHIDAVRLMTIHASKGLEFDAVHIPGMTVDSFPARNQTSPCPPPPGLIERATSAQAEEEECLFFVAASRARTHLWLYAARKQANEKNRSPSRFLSWLAGIAEDRSMAASEAVADVTSTRLEIAWSDDSSVSDAKLRAYERCPRRFFYSHVLEVGTKRVPTAYSRTEECIYEVVRWYAKARVDASIGEAKALGELDRVWPERGPVGHAFEADYRAIAERLLHALCNSAGDLRFESPEAIAVDLDGERLIVEPDELARRPDGSLVLRRVRTGYQRTTEKTQHEYRLYHLAGRARGGPAYVVEAVHLTDNRRQPIELSTKTINEAATDSTAALAAIRAGDLPPEPDAYRCPQCPHFFICPTVPSGKLTLG
jgi:DNA helicase II / ATP-dependent DNA helicase PcrA